MSKHLDLVEMRDGIPMVSSLQVAERFCRRHADVLKAIQGIEASRLFTERNFSLSEYDGRNGKNPMFWMTRDGFSLLMMGFSGKEAADWRERFIEAFNVVSKAAMEADARAPAIPKDYSELLEIQQAFFREQQAKIAAVEQKATLMLEDRTAMVNRMRAAEKRLADGIDGMRAASKHQYKVLRQMEEGDDHDDLMAKADAAKPSLALVKKQNPPGVA
jgi:Rha family phage regulatory protein